MVMTAAEPDGGALVSWVDFTPIGVDQSDQQIVNVETLPVLSTNYFGCVEWPSPHI